MNAKKLFAAVVTLLAAVGMWLGGRWTISRNSEKPGTSGGVEMPEGGPGRGHKLQPPNPNRKFEKMTPEERVKLARRGPIGG